MFNKETEYAIRALVYIQKQNLNNLRPGIIEIAKEINAPQFFVGKILQRLVRHGFIESIKGKGGGFYFDQNKSDLPLKELIIATEGGKIFSDCGFGLQKCDDTNHCPLHSTYSPIREALNTMYSTESIQKLARKNLK